MTPLPCVHLDPHDSDRVNAAGQRSHCWRDWLYYCALHGEDVARHPQALRGRDGVRCCASCPDRRPVDSGG